MRIWKPAWLLGLRRWTESPANPPQVRFPLLQILYSREKYRENSANEGTGGVYTPPEILASTAVSRKSRWIDLRLNSEILAP
jgi:hypothetical protein